MPSSDVGHAQVLGVSADVHTVNVNHTGDTMKFRYLLGFAALLVLGACTPQIAPVSPGAPAAPKVMCAGKVATIVGTSGNDTLHGTSRADVIVAGSGRDAIYGNGGGDTICAGPGNDRVYGGAGVDLIYGDAGPKLARMYSAYAVETNNDMLDGGLGTDVFDGGAGTDSCGVDQQAEQNGALSCDQFAKHLPAPLAALAEPIKVITAAEAPYPSDIFNSYSEGHCLANHCGGDARAYCTIAVATREVEGCYVWDGWGNGWLDVGATNGQALQTNILNGTYLVVDRADATPQQIGMGPGDVMGDPA